MDSVGHIRLDDVSVSDQITKSPSRLKHRRDGVTMTKTIKCTVTIVLTEDDDRDVATLIEQVDEAISDRVDGWLSVDVEHVE